MFRIVIFCSLIGCLTTVGAGGVWGQDNEVPVELGKVSWGRNLEKAVAESKATQRPVFLLFQEVPGCATCQGFGRNPLSHPLMVEAIEDLFVPVVVYNNKGGQDATTLKSFGEPAWNNPVVRFLDSNGKDVIARREGVWAIPDLAARMVQVLEKTQAKVPKYLADLTDKSTLEVATFAMHCYWVGEAKLGAIPGVRNTRSAWKSGLEVVQLEFDPQKVSYQELVKEAIKMECATKVFAHSKAQLNVADAVAPGRGELASTKVRDAKQSDQVYYLRNSVLKFLPMTEWQATKLNGILHRKITEREKRSKIAKILSPRQQKMFAKVERRFRMDPNSLKGLVWPNKDSQLALYHQKLVAVLDQ